MAICVLPIRQDTDTQRIIEDGHASQFNYNACLWLTEQSAEEWIHINNSKGFCFG